MQEKMLGARLLLTPYTLNDRVTLLDGWTLVSGLGRMLPILVAVVGKQ
jgi:hypothetical protein